MIRAGDRTGLERLGRYGARPAFSLERLSLLPDGRVAYQLRKARRTGATHLVLAPVHFLARIAAIVPPPRFPLVRFAGVLAPGSRWRARVVPRQRTAQLPSAERGVDSLWALEVGHELGVEKHGATDRRARARSRPRLALVQSYRERPVSSFFISPPLRRACLPGADEPHSVSTFSIDHEQDARARRAPNDDEPLIVLREARPRSVRTCAHRPQRRGSRPRRESRRSSCRPRKRVASRLLLRGGGSLAS